MGRAKQGGSILGYVIVGGVLTLLLLGGAYALRNNWAGQPAGTPDEVVDQPRTSAPGERQDKEKPATPPQQPAPTTPATPRTTPPASTAPNAQQLPQSGPADTLLSVAILVIVMASAGLYAESRRHARSL